MDGTYLLALFVFLGKYQIAQNLFSVGGRTELVP